MAKTRKTKPSKTGTDVTIDDLTKKGYPTQEAVYMVEYINKFKMSEADAFTQATQIIKNLSLGTEDKKDQPYPWLSELPEGFEPPARVNVVDNRLQITRGPGLIDAKGSPVKNADGSQKLIYEGNDVQNEWRGLPFAQRQEIARQMKGLGLYGANSPSLNFDQFEDFNAFARLLYTGNQEGLSWDAALQLLKRRGANRPLPQGAGYTPTSLADLKRTIQAQSEQLLGRQLTQKQAKSVASKAQQRERAENFTATRRDEFGNVESVGRAQRPVQTTTITEEAIKEEFGAEEQAFNFARAVETILGA